MRRRDWHVALAAVALCASTAAWAQDAWKPTRPVTLIAPNAPGGNSDRLGREMQRLLQAHRIVDVPVLVVNRPGGAGTIALNQLMSSPGDGHLLLIGTSGLLSNHITGLSQYNYNDVTTLALMLEDYYGVNVRTNSPIQTAQDMLERMRKAPDALALGTTSVAGSNYTSLVIRTTDAPVAGMGPTAMPPPLSKSVVIRCASATGTTRTVPADAASFLTSSGATRVEARYARTNRVTGGAPFAPYAVEVGHAVAGYTTP